MSALTQNIDNITLDTGSLILGHYRMFLPFNLSFKYII